MEPSKAFPNLKVVENQFLAPNYGALFQQSNFFKLHQKGARGIFFEMMHENGNVVANIHFTETQEGIWKSPVRGTFGGIYSEDKINFEELIFFYQYVENFLREKNASQLQISLAPLAHDPSRLSQQVFLLRSNGFSISQCDLNHSAHIIKLSSGLPMSKGNQKRVNKCLREGFSCSILQPHFLDEVYEVILENRISKGYPISMSLSELKEMTNAFPEVIKLFGVSTNPINEIPNLIASAICISLSRDILYVFYWGDKQNYSTFSPIALLAETIYDYCNIENISLLDVGTSSMDLIPNLGLIQFKQNLGFTESLKIQMAKNL